MQGLFPKSFTRKTNLGKGNKSRTTGQILVVTIFLPNSTMDVGGHQRPPVSMPTPLSPIWIATSAFSTGGDADDLHFPDLASGELDVATRGVVSEAVHSEPLGDVD